MIASERIERFRAKYETEDSDAFKDILYRNLHTISESADKLPDHIKKEYPDIEWSKVKGFRNLIVHDYLGDDINPKIVRNIVFRNLSELRNAAADILKRYP
ncbi:HepT-like ribonuclease domain-containing protein [Bartonella sp. B35(2025)]